MLDKVSKGGAVMADFPSLPLFTDSFISDTVHLDATETGAYIMLLMSAWRTPTNSLPDDDRRLCRYARCSAKQWQRIKPAVMQFWTLTDSGWRQKKLDKVRRKVEAQRELMSAAGKASALKRQETNSANVAPPLQQPKPKPKPEDSSPYGEAPKAVDPAKLVYDAGKSLLARYGIANGKAGALLTNWRKRTDDARMLTIIADAGAKERSDPVAYIEAAVQSRSPPQKLQRVSQTLFDLMQDGWKWE